MNLFVWLTFQENFHSLVALSSLLSIRYRQLKRTSFMDWYMQLWVSCFPRTVSVQGKGYFAVGLSLINLQALMYSPRSDLNIPNSSLFVGLVPMVWSCRIPLPLNLAPNSCLRREGTNNEWHILMKLKSSNIWLIFVTTTSSNWLRQNLWSPRCIFNRPLFLLIDGQYDIIAEIVLLDNFSLWEKISKHQTILKRNAHLVRKSLVSVAKWSPAFLNPIEPKFDVLQIRVAYLVLQKLCYKSSTHEGRQVC